MNKTILLILLTASLVGLSFWGCSSNMDSGGDQSGAGSTLADAQHLGNDNCLVCHSAQAPHTGFNAIAGFVAANGIDTLDVVTHDCEDCHGGGQYHNGIPAGIPFASPDGARCATCHSQATKILASKHNAADATNTAMLADGHDTGYCQRCHVGEAVYSYGVVFPVVGDKTNITNTIVDYGDTPGGGQVAALNNVDSSGNAVLHNPVCATCHNPLTKALVTAAPGTTFPAVADWDPNQSGTSDEFDLCTFCHNFYNNDNATLFGSGENGTAEFYHNNSWYRIIPTTHYDNPATSFQTDGSDGDGILETNNKVEGYVVRTTSTHPCLDCHGHEFKTNTGDADDPAEATIHTMWAKSGHAAGLLDAVMEAVDAVDCSASASLSRGKCNEQVNAAITAYADDSSSNGGYTHYDWDCSAGQDCTHGGVDESSSRASCQKCHTSTGFVNYATNPTTYDAANNSFTHLSGWVAGATSSKQNELLYCWGCHSNAETGALRVSGAVTADYTYGGTAVIFPDSGKSNSCNVCHGGRGNNETVSTSSRFAGHHAPAAATLYSALTHVAYEFPGLSYADKSYFAHNGLGSDDGSGPCVTCHMSGTMPNHEFAVVAKNSSNVITGINADICVTCHDGEHALFVSTGLVGTTADIWNGTAAVSTVVTQTMADEAAATLEEESEEYQEAGQLLLDLLAQANGLTNYAGATINQNSTPDNDKGAFQNSKLISDEKGGFAHNRYYVKRAIFDAIDWVEDGAIDGTITNYTALGTSYHYAGAINWLGTTRP